MGPKLTQAARAARFIREENLIRSNSTTASGMIWGETASFIFTNAPLPSDCVVESAVGPVKLALSIGECYKRNGTLTPA